MADKTSITNLPQVQGVSEDDLLIVQDSTSTNSIKFSNFILGPENVNFYQTIATNESKINTLTNQSISATDTLASLSGVNPGSDGNKNIVYVKEQSSGAGLVDTGGFFIFDYSETAADNGGTIIDPTSAAVTGRWKRINYDFIDPRWFGMSNTASDNQPYLQAAIDYSISTGVYKPVKIPNGTFNTKGISAGPGTIITGSGTSILQQINGGQSSLILIEGDNTIIENLELIGTYNNGFHQNNIRINGCNDVTVRNCRVQSASSNGIVLLDTQRCKISDNLVYRSGGNGIAIHSTAAAVDQTSGSMRNVVNNNIVYDSVNKDLIENASTGSDNPNYNIITSNICDTTSKLKFTGTNSITGLNVVNDVGTAADIATNTARFAAGQTTTRGISGWTDGIETYTITDGLITSIS
jgi:parallel beta-helix repeat protein